jgi:hypothetical protein
MATLAEIRAQYPQYKDLNDQQLADGLYRKFYSDMPRDQFDAKVGLKPAPAAEPPAQRGNLLDTTFQGVLGGFGDEVQGVSAGIRSMVNGGTFKQGYDFGKGQADADLAAVRERQPIAAAATEFAGGMVPAALIPAGGAFRAASTGEKIARGAISGGALGALTGAGNAEGGVENRLKGAREGAELGAVTGAAIPAAGRVVGQVLARRAANAAVPSAPGLKEAAQTLYRAAEKEGVGIKPQSFVNAVDGMMGDLRQAGINAKQQPKSFETFQILRRARDAAARGARVDLKDMETLRQIAGNVLKDPDANERRVSHVIVDGIDNFMGNLQHTDVVSGNPQRAVGLLKDARNLWQRQSKADIISTAFEKAKNAVGANYTAAGLDTALRQKFKAIADNPRAFKRFSKGEQAAILDVVRGGSKAQNALRFIGRFAPHGWVSGAGHLGILQMFGPIIAGGAMGVTSAAKVGARGLAKRAMNNVDVMVRNGGSLPPIDPLARLGIENAANLALLPAGQSGVRTLRELGYTP